MSAPKEACPQSVAERLQDLTVTRTLQAPLRDVWEAWKDPELVKGWWGPQGFTSPSAVIDFREGGTSIVCMRAPPTFGGRDYYATWTYTRIWPFQVIEFVHNISDARGRKLSAAEAGLPPGIPQDQRHRVTLKVLDAERTEITVVEEAWPPGEMMERSRLALSQCLDKIAFVLARLARSRGQPSA